MSAPAAEPAIVLDELESKRLVSGNRRIHHMVRAQTCAYWRVLARDAAYRAFGGAEQGEAWFPRARIVLTFRFPDLRRRDVSNLYPYVAKPIVDGLVDARVLPDDDDRHLVGPDLRRDAARGPHRVLIHIEEVQP